jgi:uncharacterized protein (UPF0297 family)
LVFDFRVFIALACLLVEYSKTRGVSVLDKTVVFSLENEVNQEIRKTMVRVYKALDEKGYNPVNQIVGYILSEDPTYITTFKNARNLISKIDRDELLRLLVKKFLSC